MTQTFETVIIGGGQAGLAVGYHLATQHRSFVILDASERIGDAWRNRWDSLRVFTPARYDGLPGWSFPAPGWSYPSKDDVADYLESYATRFHLPVHTGTRVDSVSRDNGEYVVTSGLSRYVAHNVVVAAGGYQAPRIPEFATELDPTIRQFHSTQYRNPSQFQAGPVLVVGAGNSGAEIALESAADHQTRLAGRDTGQEPVRPGSSLDRLFTPLFWFLLSHVLTMRTPIGRKAARQLSNHGLPVARARRKDLLRVGVERVPRITGVRDGLPLRADGQTLDVTNVIWCTGFVPDYHWIQLPILDQDGRPSHDRGVTSEPGLYFIGLFFQSAGTSSLIGGVARDARHIATHLTARTTQRYAAAHPRSDP
jgi:putative flavoprotein involved in K+ transport